jgi:radical SAM protein with 4Fe4S-binding SPASM domain
MGDVVLAEGAEMLSATDPELPTYIHMEITNVCNFKCSFCPIGGITRKNGFMDVGVARHIIDKIVDEGFARATHPLYLHQMGDPMLHPRLFDIIEHANSRGLYVDLVTNGSFLTGEALGGLANANATLSISYQTPTEDSFAHRHAKNLSFEKYRDLVFGAVEYKFANSTRTNYHWSIFFTGYHDWYGVRAVNTEDDVLRLKDDLDRFGLKLAGTYGLPYTQHSPARFREMVDTQTPFQFLPGVEIQVKHPYAWPKAKKNLVTQGFCQHPWNYFVIYWNGDTSICCLDADNGFDLGNVMGTPLADIWNGDRARAIRQGFANNEAISPVCQSCLSPS